MSGSIFADDYRREPEPLLRKFYNCDPRVVARELLGKLLIRNERGHRLAGRIVETEAYMGSGDAAAHAAAGRTHRNAVLFGPPGFAYVYFIYGMHYCLNVSCLEEGNAGCVLIRALAPIEGLEQMTEHRHLSQAATLAQRRQLSSGPGRLAQALGITRARDNGRDLTDPGSGLWIGTDGYRPAGIAATPRVGIRKAVEHPLRFVIAGDPYVSGKKTPLSR